MDLTWNEIRAVYITWAKYDLLPTDFAISTELLGFLTHCNYNNIDDTKVIEFLKRYRVKEQK